MQSILPKITMATFVFFSFINTQAQTAQKIGDNPTILDNSAVLEIQSTKKGLLPPRMTEAQRGGINLPATGLVIYNLTSKRLEVWDGAAWSGGDNLGNHTAITDLNMNSKNTTNWLGNVTNGKTLIFTSNPAVANSWNVQNL